MRLLSSALYCEGSTDAQFLRPVLQRLCERTAARAREPVDVPEVLILEDEPRHRDLVRAERIELSAKASDGAWVVLFIHADADSRDARTARSDRVAPAIERLVGFLGQMRQAVPVVPVRMTDAWVLADVDAFRSGVGTTLDDRALGLADVAARGADQVNDPKALLLAAFDAARPRIRPAQRAAFVGRIGAMSSFECLQRFQAFRQLESDLDAALRTLGIVR
jgi:hypothetical protein